MIIYFYRLTESDNKLLAHKDLAFKQSTPETKKYIKSYSY